MHQPVMVQEVLEGLQLSQGDTIVDATVGAGGHSREIARRIVPGGKLIGIDCDDETLEIARRNLAEFHDSLVLIRENFRQIDTILAMNNIQEIDGALFDLGISSYQLESATRGFGFKTDSHLDMRMDRRNPLTAFRLVNRLPERELADVLFAFGEEHASRRIARAIVIERSKKEIRTTGELAGIVERALGKKRFRFTIHPATRTFQALRIAVNDELKSDASGIEKAVDHITSGGRICVISFHSLEDRIVKNIFRDCARQGTLRVITKKPLRPSAEETGKNPRARSARLRIAEKI